MPVNIRPNMKWIAGDEYSSSNFFKTMDALCVIFYQSCFSRFVATISVHYSPLFFLYPNVSAGTNHGFQPSSGLKKLSNKTNQNLFFFFHKEHEKLEPTKTQ